MKKNYHHAKKAKPYASHDHFWANYVLTWNRFGKVVIKYVGPCTNNTLLKSSVCGYQRLLLLTSKDPSKVGYLKPRLKFVL
uniref:Uncharacterized protein n=1 Tax=Arundo donax TaxID=35708 RepID=A0A0A9FAT5_ARUDO